MSKSNEQIDPELKKTLESSFCVYSNVSKGNDYLRKAGVKGAGSETNIKIRDSKENVLRMAKEFSKRGEVPNAEFCLQYARKLACLIGKYERTLVEAEAFPLNIELSMKHYLKDIF